ncbi:MAG: hypothetical protein PCFJNLEI_04215 [Verrucomicrobiae bacterium]|nr:hypothetical protein [Verrucomicrobiae bacterium]
MGKYDLKESSKPCVRIYRPDEVASEWKSGVVGWLIRYRGIGTSGFLTLSTMGVPFWWPEVWGRDAQINVIWCVSLTFLLVFASVTLGLIYLRGRIFRSLETKAILHKLAECVRDDSRAVLREKNLSADQAIRQHVANFADLIRDLFRQLARNSTVEVAVRVAYPITSNQFQYRTVARTSGLNSKRSETSVPLDPREGVAATLLQRRGKCVVFIDDLEEAIRQGFFRKTPNEEEYRSEISTLMIAGLNAHRPNSERNEMIGILYIVSRDNRPFSVYLMDSIAFSADMLALSVSLLVEQLSKGGRE